MNERCSVLNHPASVASSVASFSRLMAEEKAIFLALLVFELTLVGRETYDVGEEGLINPARLRVINEVLHRIASYLIAMKQEGSRPEHDEHLVRSVLDHPGDAGLQRQLAEAFDRALTMSSAIR
ncbi:MAG TPA: hypothetical protein VF590_16210 [Isosphaeraceae bacterium]